MSQAKVSIAVKMRNCVRLQSSLRKCIRCLTYYFTIIVIRPVVVLGFMIGSTLLAIIKGRRNSAVNLFISSGLNLALWFVILVGSSAYLDWKQKVYATKLQEVYARFAKMLTIRQHIKIRAQISASRDRNSFTLVGHDVTSWFFLYSILDTMTNVMLFIDLLKDQL